MLRPLLVSTALTRPSPSKASTSSPPMKVDAVVLQPLLEPAPGVVAEGARERHLLDRHHRAVVPCAVSEAATSAAM